MICPHCNAAACRRSHRRTLLDYLFSPAGYSPWRCGSCSRRFYSRNIKVTPRFSAHCSVCGNMELMRISGDYVTGFTSPLWRLLGIPAFRCVPCRRKFFSLRPLRREYRENEFKAAS